MTKGQAARALANAIGEFMDADGKLQNLFQQAGLRWTDFEGAASSRLFQAICRATATQLQVLVDETAQRYQRQKGELTQLLQEYLVFPGTVWDERISGAFNAKCPYPGMRSFISPTGFYGREELTARIRQKVEETPLVLVTGASGSGKSSVVVAGVFTEWKKEHGDESVFIVRPEGDPFQALYSAIFPSLGQAQAEPFRQPSRNAFTQLAKRLAADGITYPLIFVDPFEKLFAIESESATKLRDEFVASLVEFAMHNNSGARIILGMRDEFLGSVSKFPDLCRYTDAHLVRVFPMDEDSLRMAIQRPAADHGVTLEPEIVTDIVTRVLDRNGMLPLMQDVLRQVWTAQEKTDLASTHKLAGDTYFKLGGVIGSLTNRLDALCKEKGEENLRRIFLRTIQVTADSTTPAISRRGRRSELSSGDQSIISDLIDCKVLVGYDREPGQTDGSFGLPHEAVIQNWAKLKTWIADSRHILALLSRLNEDVIDRERKLAEHPDQATKIDQECLWRGGRLEDLTKLEASDCEQLGFTTAMQGFLRDSQNQEKEERELDHRRARKILVVVSSLLCVAMIFGFGALYQTSQVRAANEQNLKQLHTASMAEHAAAQRCVEEHHRDTERTIYVQSDGRVSKWHEAIAHWESALFLEPGNQLARYGLYDLLVQEGHHNWNVPLATVRHKAAVNTAMFSPDGKWIVTASEDKTAQLWEAETGKPIGPPLRHSDSVKSAVFSPNGKWIVTAAFHNARVWEVATGRLIGQPMRHDFDVNSATFSPDGKCVVTASYDNTARVWEAATGNQIGKSLMHEGVVECATFSPDGKWVVTASRDNTARVWEAATGNQIGKTLMHADSVESATFSPDGKWVVTASHDTTAKVWEVATGNQVGKTLPHNDRVKVALFSPDGQRIVTACKNDTTAQVWEATTGNQIGQPLRHESWVSSAMFSSDGEWIVTATWDKTAQVWDATTGKPIGQPLHQDVVYNSQDYNHIALFSPDGRLIVTVNDDGTTRVWEAPKGNPIGQPLRHEDEATNTLYRLDKRKIGAVSEIAAKALESAIGQPIQSLLRGEIGGEFMEFSPDGKWLVSIGVDRTGETAQVWQTATGNAVGQPLRHKGRIKNAMFSPDGKWIVTASWDKTARVWEAFTGNSIGIPLHHADSVNSAMFSPDSKWIVTASRDKTARVWETASGKPIGQSLHHEDAVSSAIFSPNGKWIATVSSHTTRLWDAATGDQIGQPLRHDQLVYQAMFSPDGKWIITESVGATKLWEVLPETGFVGILSEDQQTTLSWLIGISGLRFDKDSGELQVVPDEERRRLLRLVHPPSEWRILAEWLRKRGSDRTISPHSKMTIRQIAEKERDSGPEFIGTRDGLESALKYDPTIPLARMMLAKLIVDEERQKPEISRVPSVFARAAHWRRYDLDRLPRDPALWKRAAAILRQAPPEDPVGIGPNATTVAKSIEVAVQKAREFSDHAPADKSK